MLTGLLHSCISSHDNMLSDVVPIIAGDFNHTDLKAVLPKFHKHIRCAIIEDNTLDKGHSKIKLGYRA